MNRSPEPASSRSAGSPRCRPDSVEIIRLVASIRRNRRLSWVSMEYGTLEVLYSAPSNISRAPATVTATPDGTGWPWRPVRHPLSTPRYRCRRRREPPRGIDLEYSMVRARGDVDVAGSIQRDVAEDNGGR